jgi:hypothetical protein
LQFTSVTTYRRADIARHADYATADQTARRGDGRMEMDSLKELYVDELKDLWSA